MKRFVAVVPSGCCAVTSNETCTSGSLVRPVTVMAVAAAEVVTDPIARVESDVDVAPARARPCDRRLCGGSFLVYLSLACRQRCGRRSLCFSDLVLACLYRSRTLLFDALIALAPRSKECLFVLGRGIVQAACSVAGAAGIRVRQRTDE